ncbi:MAG: hypothetical protein HY391_06100 [Deltaproteobacteria bacterium]|nr:hypothetical protein [Deltaproteobacteria bacterium]
MNQTKKEQGQILTEILVFLPLFLFFLFAFVHLAPIGLQLIGGSENDPIETTWREKAETYQTDRVAREFERAFLSSLGRSDAAFWKEESLALIEKALSPDIFLDRIDTLREHLRSSGWSEELPVPDLQEDPPLFFKKGKTIAFCEPENARSQFTCAVADSSALEGDPE